MGFNELALLSAFGLAPPAAGETGTAASAINNYGSFIAGGGNTGTNGWPKGYLNILVFNKEFQLVDLAFQQLDAAYPGRNARSRANLTASGLPTAPGKDRDEFLPAVLAPSGRVSVRLISSGDNRSAGAQIGAQLNGVKDGTTVIVVPINVPKK